MADGEIILQGKALKSAAADSREAAQRLARAGTAVSGLGEQLRQAQARAEGFYGALQRLRAAANDAAQTISGVAQTALAGILRGLATGMEYLAALLRLLTGRSLAAMKTTAKGMMGVGRAAASTARQAQKAANSLAGFDELERLDAPQEDTGTAGGAAVPGGEAEKDTSFLADAAAGLESLLLKLRGFWAEFTALFAPAVAAWGAAWEQIKTTAAGVWPDIQAAALGLWQNGLLPLITYLGETFVPGVVNSFSAAFAPIVGGAVSAGIQTFADFFVWACGLISDAVNTVVIPALDVLLTIWQGLMEGIQSAWAAYGQPLMDGFAAAFANLEQLITALWETVVKPVLRSVIGAVEELWEQHLKPLWDDLTALFAEVGLCILAFWNNVAAPLAAWLIETFGPTFAQVFGACAEFVGGAFGVIADVIDVAVTVFRGVVRFLTAVFQGDWDAAWDAVKETVSDVWEKIGDTVKGCINNIIGFVNGMVSAIADGINVIVDGLNSLSIDAPDWAEEKFGITSFGFNIPHIQAPQIPLLAKGAVIPPNREFLAVLGDQTNGTNIEAPLATIEEAVANVMAELQGAQLAGFEAVVAVLREILEAVLGIEIGDEVIGQAYRRWQQRQAVMEGGGA